MNIVNPVEPAANFFLGWLQLLPSPVRLLMYAAVGFFVITILVKVIIK